MTSVAEIEGTKGQLANTPSHKKSEAPKWLAMHKTEGPTSEASKQTSENKGYEGTHANKDVGVALKDSLKSYSQVNYGDDKGLLQSIKNFGALPLGVYAKANPEAAKIIEESHNKIKDKLSECNAAEEDLKNAVEKYNKSSESSSISDKNKEAMALANKEAAQSLDKFIKSQSLSLGTKYNSEIRKVAEQAKKDLENGVSPSEALSKIKSELENQKNSYKGSDIEADVLRDLNKIEKDFAKTVSEISKSETKLNESLSASEETSGVVKDSDLENAVKNAERAREALKNVLDEEKLNIEKKLGESTDPQIKTMLATASSGKVLAVSPEKAALEMDPEVQSRREFRRQAVSELSSSIKEHFGEDSFLMRELKSAQAKHAEDSLYNGVDRKALKAEVEKLMAEKKVKGSDIKSINEKIETLKGCADLIDEFYKKVERTGFVEVEKTDSAGKTHKVKEKQTVTFKSKYDEMTFAYLMRREKNIESQVGKLNGEAKEAKAEELRASHPIIKRQHVQEGHQFGMGVNGSRWDKSIQFNVQKEGGNKMSGLALFLKKEHATTTGYGTHQVSVFENPGAWIHKEAGSYGLFKLAESYLIGRAVKPITDALGIGKFLGRILNIRSGGSLPGGNPGDGGIGFDP